ncbi:MAG TPA: hypothetical protein PK264_08240 [Hyphomicrobiaceae bacterium]|nr:hypothetical protein [Hyphomicrobiaceae bacterium]
MPSDVKAIVSALTALVAVGFAFWERAYGQAHLFWLVLGLGAFAIVAMWVFPEATMTKADMPPKPKPGREA